MLNMLGGMDLPSEGKITVAGREISFMNDKELGNYRADVIEFIFQFYNLLPSLTAYGNIVLIKSIVKNAGDPVILYIVLYSFYDFCYCPNHFRIGRLTSRMGEKAIQFI